MRQTPIDHFPVDQDVRYSRIFAGAMWPGVRPGWVVVVGEHATEHIAGRPCLDVLDVADSPRLDRLISLLAELRDFFHPERVLADARNAAAMTICNEYAGRGLRVEHSGLCELRGPMAYVMPLLQRIYSGPGSPGDRLRVSPASALAGEMLVVPANEDPADLRLEDYPAVAALAFAALGLELSRRDAAERLPEQTRR
ncbi:MAG TPA: hypothetical protein PLL20_19370 [Phycisphaerae bacterium]|nr:hypothetical protein [Phycisphaerae bacterium]